MMKSELSKKIMALDKREDRIGSLLAIEAFLEDLLSRDSTNVDLWFRLAICEIQPPLTDSYKNIACLNHVLEIDPHNVPALVCLAYTLDRTLGGIDEKLFNQLNSAKTDSAEFNSMLKYVATWYQPVASNLALEEKYLRESIAFYQGHVWNYFYLALLCQRKNQHVEAQALFHTALYNVVKVYDTNSEDYDPTDVDEYINEHIKGIYISSVNLESIKKELL